MKTIYENGRGTLVRIVVFAGIAAGIAGLYASWAIFQTYGLSPGDGGVLKPFSERLAFAGVIASLGLAAAGGLALYASLYVTAIQADANGQRYKLTTLSLFSAREHDFQLSDFTGSKYFHGQLHTPKGPRVNAPWVTLRATGRALPFILDVQADANPQALDKIAPGAAAVWGHHDD